MMHARYARPKSYVKTDAASNSWRLLCVNVGPDVKRATGLVLTAGAIVLITIPLAYLVVAFNFGSAVAGFAGH